MHYRIKNFQAWDLGILLPLTDVEIYNDKRGAPQIKLRGRAADLAQAKKIFLSLSHAHDFATATCIIE
ncbi:MAG: hypothetical protein II857_00810 [Selenomonadaceae bacterium]|nr:hypothetical protein [Selenomonadaceae bacterium]